VAVWPVAEERQRGSATGWAGTANRWARAGNGGAEKVRVRNGRLVGGGGWWVGGGVAAGRG
jgi:hypothetical protein